MFADRKTSFKLPPTTIRDKLVSQEARRSKALEEQKRRRAQKIDSSRQLDQFADLNLGGISDDEDEDEPAIANVTPASVARYATMIEPSLPLNAITGTLDAPEIMFGVHEVNPKQKSKKKKKKKKSKPSKWADKCMYAELLEMSPEEHWFSDGDGANDGLPNDLETAWVAVAPVPVGKRCLAVTHQSAGVVGVVPNTTLRSRLLGKTLIPRFPSTLPPLTILDCILDANWRDNGILHVLDVIKWKGQDVCDCEAPFRFWWRDTRLAELSQTFPPNLSFSTIVNPLPDPSPSFVKPRYCFPYPTKFLPVPYHTDTSLATLQSQIIPLARTFRGVDVEVPVALDSDPAPQGTMDMDSPSQSSFTFCAKAPVEITSVATTVEPDGLLLYISEASYEAGTSPLSNWIPINGYESSQPSSTLSPPIKGDLEGPLDIFQRLVKCRLEKKAQQIGQPEYVDMDV